jgi:hypothetical protein
MQISRYHEALSRYFDRFPRDQIDIFLFDDLKADASGCVRAVYEAIGVDPGFTPDLETPHNIGGLPSSRTLEKVLTSRSVRRVVEPWIPRGVSDAIRRVRTKNLRKAPPLPDALRAELQGSFRDDIHATASLTGRNLDHWLPPA